MIQILRKESDSHQLKILTKIKKKKNEDKITRRKKTLMKWFELDQVSELKTK